MQTSKEEDLTESLTLNLTCAQKTIAFSLPKPMVGLLLKVEPPLSSKPSFSLPRIQILYFFSGQVSGIRIYFNQFVERQTQSHPIPRGNASISSLLCCLDDANNPKKVTKSIKNIEGSLRSLLDENRHRWIIIGLQSTKSLTYLSSKPASSERHYLWEWCFTS